MKRQFALAISLCFTLLAPQQAKAFVPVACNAFEVSYIQDNGDFSAVSCVSSLAEAKQKMKENPDYVVRHRASDSLMDIVAMNSGIAYIYTHRYSDKATIGLWERPYNKEYVLSYTDSYREMLYQDTTEFDTSNGEGTIIGTLNGFTGGIGLEYVDLVPDKFLQRSLPVTVGGGYREKPVSFIPQRAYFSVEREGNYRDLVYHYFPAYPKSNSSYQPHYRYAIGPAPDTLQEHKEYYSSDGVHFYSDLKETNLVTTHYNYYQFVPLRSQSNIKLDTYNRFFDEWNVSQASKMRNTANDFKEAEQKYGINASIVFGIGLNESAFGMSYFARNRNNLFGLNAVDSDPNQATSYPTVKEAIDTMTSYYAQSYIDVADWRFFGSSLGNKGSGLNVKYASDPHWSIKASKYYYYLDKLDNNLNGQLTDYNKATLAKVKNIQTNFYRNSELTDVLYTSRYGKTYQKDFIVNVLETTENYVKVQFTNPIQNNKVLMWKDIQYRTQYDWNTSVAYLRLSDIEFINREQPKIVEQPTQIVTISNISVDYGKMIVQGSTQQPIQTVTVYKDDVVHSLENVQLTDTFSYTIPIRKWTEDGKYKVVFNDEQIQIPENDYFPTVNGSLIIKDRRVLPEPIIKHIGKFTVDTLEVSNQDVTISGTAFIDGYDLVDKERIQHSIIVENVDTGNRAIEEVETVQVTDGRWIGFRSTFSFADYKYGTFRLKIHIKQDGDERIFDLAKENTVLYGNELFIKSQQDNAHKLLVEKSEHIEEINKPTTRESYVRLDDVPTYMNNRIQVTGTGILFGVDLTNVRYELILEGVKKYSFSLESKDQEYNLTKIINSPEDINHSIFTTEGVDLSSVEKGTYKVRLKIVVNDYQDVVTIKNTRNKVLPSPFTENSEKEIQFTRE